MKKQAFRAAVPYTVPVLLGYIFLGIAFGILLAGKGYSVWWAFLMSSVIYAGSMQFVAVGLLAASFQPAAAFFLTLMINARHLFYGLSMLERFRIFGRLKPYMVMTLTDETYSLLCSVQTPEGVEEKWFLFFISLLNQIYWVAGSVLGAGAGALLGFSPEGIDFAMTALFLVILVEQWESAADHRPAVLGLGATAVCRLLFGPDRFIVASMAVIFAALLFLPSGGEDGGNRRRGEMA